MCACQPLPLCSASGRELGESAGLPPERQRHRVECDLGIALLLRDRGVEAEERGAEINESLDDVVITLGDAQPQSLGMKGAVAHEVADELCELRRHALGDTRAEVGSPVEIAERRKPRPLAARRRDR